ncbi:iron-containing alcohol dehydrogenase [Pseudoflavonifractor capillosus]
MGRTQRCAMNNFIFESGTKFLFGGGCVKEYLASFLAGYGPCVLLVTEEADRRSHAADEVRDILHRSGKQMTEYAMGPFCPRYEQVLRAARLCRERRVDLILDVGGSAVMDGCKSTSLAAVCRGDLWENFGELQGVVDVPPLPIGFVASHLEVGAVNGAAGLIHERQCVWRDYPPCDPQFALLDPSCTCELSRQSFTAQGFSALAGALSVLLLADCRHEAEQHPAVLAQLARRVWETDDTGRFEQETAQDGVRAFVEFLRELELPTEYSELDDALRCHLKQSVPAQNLLVYTA